MSMEIEFDGEEASFDLVPVGDYEAYINNILDKGEGEKKYLNFMFKISDGASKGRTLFTNCMLSKEGLWKLKNVLIASGLAQRGFKGKVAWDKETLIGKKVGLRVAHEEYNEKTRESVVAIFPVGAPTPATAAPVSGTAAPVTAGAKRL